MQQPLSTPLTVQDEALMLQIVNGDQQAYRLLVKRWKQPLMNYFYRQLGDAESAEELTQEVLIKVWKTKKYQPKAKFSTFIYRLAYHVLVDHWRKQGRRPQKMESLDQSFDLPSLALSPEQQVLASESREQVQVALQALPLKQQQVLILSKFQDLKYGQIAEILDCPAKSVKVQVFRALKKLGEKLKERT